jgi:hypothetical protein
MLEKLSGATSLDASLPAEMAPACETAGGLPRQGVMGPEISSQSVLTGHRRAPRASLSKRMCYHLGRLTILTRTVHVRLVQNQ